jgi:hypothetical protein
MGVDMRVRLPNNVRVRNVAEVMGAYAGCTPVKSFFRGDSKGGWHASVPGAKVTTTSLPEMAQITIDCPMVDGQTSHFCFYHFEPESGSGRLMLPRSTAFWIALMTKVVDFFGGELDYNDSDDSECDYSVPEKTVDENSPQDGEAWYNFQNRVLNIKPLTKEEWEAADKHAAYKIGE